MKICDGCHKSDDGTFIHLYDNYSSKVPRPEYDFCAKCEAVVYYPACDRSMEPNKFFDDGTLCADVKNNGYEIDTVQLNPRCDVHRGTTTYEFMRAVDDYLENQTTKVAENNQTTDHYEEKPLPWYAKCQLRLLNFMARLGL